MGLSEEDEENILQRFDEICLDLNMDTTTKEEAWQNYQKIQTNFTLEVGPMLFPSRSFSPFSYTREKLTVFYKHSTTIIKKKKGEKNW